jgi:modulator of FtsH protease HflK
MSWNEPGGNDKDPWSDRNNTPPDLDEVLRSLQNKFNRLFGGSNNSSGNNGQEPSTLIVGIIVAVSVTVWLAFGTYTVEQSSRGVVTRFGAYSRTTTPGLNWHLPAPIEQVQIINIEEQRYIEVGYRSGSNQPLGSIPKESMMLTKDENIIDVRLAVQYKVKDAKDFAFNVLGPSSTLKQVTESVERAVIGRNDMDYVLTEGRSEIVQAIKNEIQTIMDSYQAGILITSVNLQDAQPPSQVQGAFDDAIKAREDKQRLINEAEAYANDIVPKARGLASRIVQESEAYKERVIAQSTGDASRFSQLLTAYKKAPAITRQRMYLEAVEQVVGSSTTILVDSKTGGNMLYLPIDKLANDKSPAAAASSASEASPSSNSGPVVQVTPTAPKDVPKPADARAFSRERDVRGR